MWQNFNKSCHTDVFFNNSGHTDDFFRSVKGGCLWHSWQNGGLLYEMAHFETYHQQISETTPTYLLCTYTVHKTKIELKCSVVFTFESYSFNSQKLSLILTHFFIKPHM